MQKKGAYDNPFSATLKGIKDLFSKKDRIGELKESENLDGKTVLITGASSGLGLATSVRLAKKGANVIMACRSGIPDKGEYVKKQSGSTSVSMIHVDLSDINSIKSFIANIIKGKIRIDILICNAAMVPRNSRKTRQGLEEMFVVNYLSKYIIVRALWEADCFNTSDSHLPRIIFVSSESHRNPEAFDWEGFGKYRAYSIGKTVALYGYYKLLLTTLANEFSRRVNTDKTNVSVFALCPGPVNSNIAREAPSLFKPLLKIIFGIFFTPPEKAAEPIIYLSSSKDVEGKSLDYLFLMSRVEMDDKTKDSSNGTKLWELSEELLAGVDVKF